MTDKWKKITVVFIISVICGIAGFDVVAIHEGGKEASISWTLISWSYQYPSVVFILGFVMGHLFWRMKTPPATKEPGEAAQ